jgi:hypothetical protein
MQNTARARDACTKDHLDLVDDSTFAAEDLRGARLSRLALARWSLTAGHMKRDAAPASESRRQLSAQQRAVEQLRTVAKPYRFRVRADAEGFPVIPGRYGQIEWFDGRALAVYCDHPKLFRKLWAIANVRRHQTGDSEMRAVFPPEALAQVAAVIRAHRKPGVGSEVAKKIGSRTAFGGTSRPTGGAVRVENGSLAWRRS